MKEHILKTAPEYWEAQARGDKNFEIRKNDRDYRVGDIAILVYYDGAMDYNRKLKRKITYITDYAQTDGYLVIGTKPMFYD